MRVLGFAGDEYSYTPIEEMVDYKTLESGAVMDLRTKPSINEDTYLTNFRVDEFRVAAQALPVITDISEHMQALKQLALKHGDYYGA